MITLEAIVSKIQGTLIGVSPNTAFSSLTASSKTAVPGAVFIAIRGAAGDGHQYVSDAFSNGASLAIVEDAASLMGNPGIVVPDTRVALSALAALFSSEPTKELSVVGVTGTNGKTTVHWIIASLLSALGQRAVRIGTLGVAAPDFQEEGVLTTPDPVYLQQIFKRALDSKCRYAVMEVSSHAVDQHRVDDVTFDEVVFTNLTRDHLDYHQTMENYALAKARLFNMLKERGKGTKAAIINDLGEWGKWFREQAIHAGCRVETYGFAETAQLKIVEFSQSIEGSTFSIAYDGKIHTISSPFIGRYNAENVAAAIGAVINLGFNAGDVCAAVSHVAQVPGRLESCGQDGIGIYVDYAHTPDALHNALGALKPITKGKLWVIFGCGGDRDKGKRPQMALAAAGLADNIVITSDNPRTEDPQKIISDILESGVKAVLVESDRRSAITQTVSRAAPADVVLIAGKGHENYQILGTTKLHFSDQEVVRDFFNKVH